VNKIGNKDAKCIEPFVKPEGMLKYFKRKIHTEADADEDAARVEIEREKYSH
jgi:hypothetical protein